MFVLVWTFGSWSLPPPAELLLNIWLYPDYSPVGQWSTTIIRIGKNVFKGRPTGLKEDRFCVSGYLWADFNVL